jgi:outer membrane protein with beta-barrel domain
MKGSIAGLIVVASLVAAGQVYAQETTAGPGKVEVSIIPGGGTWFLHKNSAPKFGNYDLGGAAAYNFSRILGAEAEVAGSLGIKQQLNDVFGEEKTPNMLSYSGNLVANMPGHSIVPYATGGIGGLSVYRREAVAVPSTETFFTGNLGGGVKWFAPNNRWGVRGDYRFLMARGKDSVSPFFGPDNRFGNRIYGGVIINAIK